MNAETETETPHHSIRTFELWAKIKRSSKYYDQALGPDGKPIAFPIEGLFHLPARTPLESDLDDEFCVRGNSNRYRLDDVVIYVRVGETLKLLKH